MNIRWRFGLIAALFLALFSLYPQFNLMYMRGGEYNGHYAYNDIDEVAYASYVAALIDGRPRRNDPYTGRDDTPEHAQPESLFSIQFVAPYLIAIPARILGVGAPWAFTIAGAIAAFLTALIIFWLARMVFANDWLAMAASLVTLVGGAVFAGEGAMSEVFFNGFSYPYFPGFRRYIPALAFPAFFIFVGALYGITDERFTASRRSRNLAGLVAALAFGSCVFSYFYVWTAAAAWAVCFGVVYCVFRWEDLKKQKLFILSIASGCAVFLLPYAVLLADRSPTMDEVQLLSNTHSLDLGRPPEYATGLVLAVVVIGLASKIFDIRETRVLLVISLALSVFVVFNQQVITGRSLQPIHYQVFIGNYIAALAFTLTAGMLFPLKKNVRSKLIPAVAIAVSLIAVSWGFVECFYTVRVLDEVNVLRDEAFPVGKRLTELAAGDAQAHSEVILPFEIAVGDDLPTIAPQGVLWARHQHVFAGVTWQENKERYYQYLYYTGVDPEQLAASMRSGHDFVSIIALFGWGRHTDRLSADFKPLTFGELDHEAQLYADYIQNFDPHAVSNRPLDFAVVRSDSDPDWSNVDRWYTRSEPESIGPFDLYKLKLRQ